MTTDPVNHPSHYLTHRSGIECIQITEHMSFTLGNAVKYIWRADGKGDAINDLSKAVWYLEREITRRKSLADIENARLIGVIDDSLQKDLVTKSASSPTQVDDEPGASIDDIRMQAAGGDERAQRHLAEGYQHGWYGLPRLPHVASIWRSMSHEPRNQEEGE